MSDSVGSVSVEVVPDARGWSEKLRAQIRDQSVEIKADADTGEAETQLDEVARTRTAKVKVNVEKSGFDEAATKLSGFLGDLSLLPTLAIAAGSALVPLVAVLGGVAAALAAPLAIAGGGATLFALLGGAAIAQTTAQQKKLAALAKTRASAQAALESATRSAGKNAATSTSVANAQIRLNKATADYRTALAGVSPQQKGFLTALQGLKDTFSGMISGPTGKTLLQPFTDGISLLAYVLKAAGPLIRASAGGIGTLLEDLMQQVNNPGFEDFVHKLARQVGPDIVTFGRIAGNGIKGLTGLLMDLQHALGRSVLDGLLHLSRRFADLGSSAKHSDALQAFGDYFRKNGPAVASTLGSLARSLGHIVAALAPLGPPVLHIIKGIADAFNSIPIPVLTAIATAAAGLVVLSKAKKGVNALSGLIGGGGGRLGAGGVLGSLKPVPVFVTNPGFGGVPGGTGPGGVVAGAGKTAAMTGEAEAAFKFGKIGGLGGVLGTLLAAPLPALGSQGNVQTRSSLYLTKADFLRNFGGRTLLPPASDLSIYGKHGFSEAKANRILGIDPVASSTHMDALRASAAKATQQIDLIGPHADQAFAQARRDVAAFQAHLDSIHDKKFSVIADTQAAVKSLERVNALRIQNKNFTVYAHYERAVGPGGGIGHPGDGNPGPRSGSNGGGTGPINMHLHIQDGPTLRGYIQGEAQAVHDANRRFDDVRAGR